MTPPRIDPWTRRGFGRFLILALLAAAFGGAGFAHAGELARLHRELGAPVAPEMPAPAGLPAAPNQATGTPGIVPLQPLPERLPASGIERLGFEGLPCRGTCPVFTVIFYADGTFTYVGESNVERLGEGSGRVPGYFLQQIMRYVEAIGFRNLRDAYPSSLADVRTTYTLVDWGNAVKVIENQDGSAPATVWALERLFHDLLEEADWD